MEQFVSEKESVYINQVGEAREQNFDANWKFSLGEQENAQEPGFNDANWRQLDLPHDYSIEQDYSRDNEAESAYLPGGIGWYRKRFSLAGKAPGKRYLLNFDGVYMDCTVWLNGKKLGAHPYGYSPFTFDISSALDFQAENVLALRVNHQLPSSRWYSGSGIYRSVHLLVLEDTHISQYGTQILASDIGANTQVTVKTGVENQGQQDRVLQATVYVYPKGQDRGQSVAKAESGHLQLAAGTAGELETKLSIANPRLWSLDQPQLYVFETELKAGGTVLGVQRQDYGFRSLSFDANTGFHMNGQAVKLKGVCMHHDQGALGAAAYRRALERQVEKLQEMGANSIRVTHNPASRALIDICNERGMLLIEEIFDGWRHAKNSNDNDFARFFQKEIGQPGQLLRARPDETWAQFCLQETLRRDRNDPCVMLWSMGNEVMEGFSADVRDYPDIAAQLLKWAAEIDTSRPGTTGDNRLKQNQREAIEMAQRLHEAGAVIGLNYAAGSVYDKYHQAYPDWVLYGAETASAINSRNVYRLHGESDEDSYELSSYDYRTVPWGHVASEAWYDAQTRDYVAGTYTWTGFDYLGEPTPWNGVTRGQQGRHWPSPKSSYFGIIDTAGFPKDSFYFYQSLWNDKLHTLHVLPVWDEQLVKKDEAGNVDVVVYSDAPTVELFLLTEAGRRSLGKKTMSEKRTPAGHRYQLYEGPDRANNHRDLYRTWKLPFEAGSIEAVAYDAQGQEIRDCQGRHKVQSPGVPKRVALKADRQTLEANGRDLSYVEIDLQDEQKQPTGKRDLNLRVSVEGAAELLGLDNGYQADHESFQSAQRRSYGGKLLAIVGSKKQAGPIQLSVRAEGLEAATLDLEARPGAGTEQEQRRLDHYDLARNYYVKRGGRLELPETVDAHFSDGTVEALAVDWAAYAPELLQKQGNFDLLGETDLGDRLSLHIHVIDALAALLNYSCTTPVGQVPSLPQTRPAVLKNGEVLKLSFPVRWQEVPAEAYSQAGLVEIPGEARIFGQDLKLKATVRVQEEQLTLGANAAPDALELYQNIPKEQQTGILEAIRDTVTSLTDTASGGPEPTAWSNFNYAQEGHRTAELTFVYATQQRFGEFVVHHWKDSYAARYPDPNTTKIYVSETGAPDSWQELATTEEIGPEEGRVRPYTYRFSPVVATYLRFVFTNAQETLPGTRKTCVGITEIELKLVQGSFPVNRDAALERLQVNGLELSSQTLGRGCYSTAAERVELEAVGKGNAAVTILPACERSQHIILESEDHSRRGVFVFHLAADQTPDAEGDSHA